MEKTDPVPRKIRVSDLHRENRPEERAFLCDFLLQTFFNLVAAEEKGAGETNCKCPAVEKTLPLPSSFATVQDLRSMWRSTRTGDACVVTWCQGARGG